MRHSTGSRPLCLVALAAALAACGDDGSTSSTGSTTSGTTGSGGAGGATTTSAGGQGTGAAGGSTTTTTGTGGSGTGGTGTGGSVGTGGSGTGGSGTGGAMGTGGSGTGGSMADPDLDDDGWTLAQGDCCDEAGPACSDPAKVNPGAFEYLGNGVDDDCDPATSDTMAVPDCSPSPLVAPTSATDLVKAMDLCQTTTENPPLPQKHWGVIDASLTLVDGTGAPNDLQVGVLGNYGSFVIPKRGATLAALSSGTGRKESDPGYVHPQNGGAGQTGNYDAMTQTSAPTAYLAAHGGVLPNPATCPACVGANCTTAYDGTRLRVRLRVPTNARSFSYDLKFYSAEFPEFVCKAYNDFFLTLLTSSWTPDPNDPSQVPLPADRNIATDSLGNTLSVNNAFLTVCFPPFGAPPGSCPDGTLDLIGNGMGGWNNNLKDGGGTTWLTNEAPVVPGETIELEFMIWDSGDHKVDSVALLDHFKWQIDPASVGLHQ